MIGLVQCTVDLISLSSCSLSIFCHQQMNVFCSSLYKMINPCPVLLAVPCRYESPEIALNCGIMLRECIRHEPLAKITLWSEQFYDFFRYVEMSTFDIASDAFATFKVSCLSCSAVGVEHILFWVMLWNTCYSLHLKAGDYLTKESKALFQK